MKELYLTIGQRPGILTLAGRERGRGNMGQKLIVNTAEYAPGIYIYQLTMNGNTEKTGKFEVSH